MKRTTILGLLGNRGVMIGLGAVVIVAVGFYAIRGMSRSSGPHSASVAAQVLLDTTDSQLVTAGSGAVMTLPMRATLIADRMASEQMRAMIANAAHVPAGQLDVLPPVSTAAPAYSSLLTTKVAPLGAVTTAPYVVSLYTGQQQPPATPTPVISVVTEAPDATGATTLANATASALKSSVAPDRSGRPTGFVIRTVTTQHAVVIPSHSRRRIYAVVGLLGMFIVWCGLSVMVARFADRRVHTAQLA